jgi:hypothetical protein
MTVGAALFVYAVLLGTLGPLAYRRDGWLARAPRLGATLLLTAGWSVLAAVPGRPHRRTARYCPVQRPEPSARRLHVRGCAPPTSRRAVPRSPEPGSPRPA